MRTTGRSKTITVGPTERAWKALAEARWVDAKDAFTIVLEAEETPEILEGLSWAAWWLDDPRTLFDARERAFRLYRKRGEPASAGRMATWLAADQLDFHGAFAVASGWLRRAHRLLAPLELGPDHGWLAFHEGYIASMQNDTASSLELAQRAVELGRRFETADLEMLGLALQGMVLVACARVDEGMRCLDEAAATALESDARIPISRAWTCCFLVTACETARDYPRAFEWCDRIAEFAERYESRYMRGFCRAHYGAIHVFRGQWREGETELQAAVEDFARARPALVGDALAQLAELRRRQGDWEECERLLDESSGGGLHCRARLALDQGNVRQAVELAERSLRRTPNACRLTRVGALELLVRARAMLGDVGEAIVALDELNEVVRLVGTAGLRAAAEMAAGVVAAAQGDHERARRLLEDATDAYERMGAPFEMAQARLELVRSLLALGRRDAAGREAAACATRFDALGAHAELRRARELQAMASVADAETASPSAITRRERDVLRLVADGLTNRQIANRLDVSEHTIHRHVTNILRKLDLPSRTAAAAHAVRLGLAERSRK